MAKRGFNNPLNSQIYFENPSGASASIGIDSADNNTLKVGIKTTPNATIETDTCFSIDTNGNRLLPKQASFLASINVENNATVINVAHEIGSITAMTQIVDQGNNFFPGDGAGNPAVFTAPVSGKYLLGMILEVRDPDKLGADETDHLIITTSTTYIIDRVPVLQTFIGYDDNYAFSGSIFTQLDATDTVIFGLLSNQNNLSIQQGYVFGCLIV